MNYVQVSAILVSKRNHLYTFSPSREVSRYLQVNREKYLTGQPCEFVFATGEGANAFSGDEVEIVLPEPLAIEYGFVNEADKPSLSDQWRKRNEWLETLKAGDTVILSGRVTEKVVKLTGATKTQLSIGDRKFRRKYGDELGRSYGDTLIPPTPWRLGQRVGQAHRDYWQNQALERLRDHTSLVRRMSSRDLRRLIELIDVATAPAVDPNLGKERA